MYTSGDVEKPPAVLACLELSAARGREKRGGKLSEAAEAEVAGDGEDGHCIVFGQSLVPL